LTRNLLDLAGLGFGRLREALDSGGKAGCGENFFIRHAGLLAQKPLSASAVASLVGAFARVPAELVQFVGQWVELPLGEQTRLGSGGGELGCSAFIGGRLWDRQTKVQLRLGPMRRERFEQFLPGERGTEGLAELMRFSVGFGLACDVILVLDRGDVPAPRLAADAQYASVPTSGSRMGCPRPTPRDVLPASAIARSDRFPQRGHSVSKPAQGAVCPSHSGGARRIRGRRRPRRVADEP